MQINIDGALATHYIYGFKELDALQNGGVQRIYTGNVPTGGHEIAVSINGKTPSGDDFNSAETFAFDKGDRAEAARHRAERPERRSSSASGKRRTRGNRERRIDASHARQHATWSLRLRLRCRRGRAPAG